MDEERHGIQVAELVGLPKAVVERARIVLQFLRSFLGQEAIDLYMERARRSELPDYLRHRRSRPAVAEATAVA